MERSTFSLFGWDKFNAGTGRAIDRFKRDVPREGAHNAAKVAAKMLQEHLRMGIDPPLSPITAEMSLGGGVPLASLADHVIVRRDGDQSIVTFEDDMLPIAKILNDGAAYVPTAKQRRMMHARARYLGLHDADTDEGAGGGNVWVIPARKFMKYLQSTEVKEAAIEQYQRAANRHLRQFL